MRHRELVRYLRASEWADALDNRLAEPARGRMAAMTDGELKALFDAVLGPPIDYSVDMCLDVLFHYFHASWLRVFGELGLPKDSRVYEVAAGSTTSVLDALRLYTGGQGAYVTSNLNKGLSEGFLAKTADYGMDIRVVGDDSRNIGNAYAPGSFRLIAFHHAINDILWNIVGNRLGLDTVDGDWFTNAPLMAVETSRLHKEGLLKDAVYDGFIGLVGACHGVLEDGGVMAFFNCMFASDLNRGFDKALYQGLIGMAGEWIKESGLGMEAVRHDAFDPQWWLFLRKS